MCEWLSDSGTVKIQHTVQVSFKIGSYEDTVDCDVVPMSVCHLLLGALGNLTMPLLMMGAPTTIASNGTTRY